MSEEVEQITKTPVESNVKTKEKDPKKVAAGKRLAEYNKRAKEKMRREAERETGESAEAEQGSRMGGWIPEISFTTAISLVGIGLTVINMFVSYKKGEIAPPRLPESPIREHNSVIERPQPSKIPVPKMGMY